MGDTVKYVIEANSKKVFQKEIAKICIKRYLPLGIVFSVMLIFLLIVGIFFSVMLIFLLIVGIFVDKEAFIYVIPPALMVLLTVFFGLKERIRYQRGLNSAFDDINDNGLIECELTKENDLFKNIHLLSQNKTVFLKSDVRNIYRGKNIVIVSLKTDLSVIFPNIDEVVALLGK